MKPEDISIDFIKDRQWDQFIRLQCLFIKERGGVEDDLSIVKTRNRLKRVFFDDLQIQHPPYYVWVASLSGKYIGHLWSCALPEYLIAVKHKLNIFNIVLDTAYRRKGIGSRLYKCAEKFCHEHGIDVIDCQTKLADRKALLFCKSNGYAVDGVMLRRVLV